MVQKHYWAFISYSSHDRRWATWLRRRLENYRIPKEFQGVKLEDGTELGKYLRPIFRDRDELSGASELGPVIKEALSKSRYLIVLCSPNSAKSEWVNKEIDDFRKLSGNKNILALILKGEPNATTNELLNDDAECFPPALRYPSEPLAGDLRKEGDGKERGFLKILAGMTQVGFDELYRRHERSKRKIRLTLGAIATAIIAILVGLTVFAFKQSQLANTRLADQLEESGRRAVLDRRYEDALLYLTETKRIRPNSSSVRDYLLAKTWSQLSRTLAAPQIFNSWPRKVEILPNGSVIAEDAMGAVRVWDLAGKPVLDISIGDGLMPLLSPGSSGLFMTDHGVFPQIERGQQIPSQFWPLTVRLVNSEGKHVSGDVKFPNSSIYSIFVLPNSHGAIIDGNVIPNKNYTSGLHRVTFPKKSDSNDVTPIFLQKTDSNRNIGMFLNSYQVITKDEKYLLSLASDTKTITAWSLETGEIQWEKVVRGRLLDTKFSPGPATRMFVRGGELFVVCEKSIKQFQIIDGKEIDSVDLDQIRIAVVASQGEIAFSRYNEVYVRDPSGKLKKLFELESGSLITALAYSTSGEFIAIGDESGCVSCIDSDGKTHATYTAYSAPVSTVAISHEHRRVSVGYMDGAVRIYRLENAVTSPVMLRFDPPEALRMRRPSLELFTSDSGRYYVGGWSELFGLGKVSDSNKLILYDRATLKPVSPLDQSHEIPSGLSIKDEFVTGRFGKRQITWHISQPDAPVFTDVGDTLTGGGRDIDTDIWNGMLITIRRPVRTKKGEKVQDTIIEINLATGEILNEINVPEDVQLGASSTYWFRWSTDGKKFAIISPKGAAIFSKNRVSGFTEEMHRRWTTTGGNNWLKIDNGILGFNGQFNFLTLTSDGDVLEYFDIESRKQAVRRFRSCKTLAHNRASGQMAIGLKDGRIIILSPGGEVISHCRLESKSGKVTYNMRETAASRDIAFDQCSTLIGGISADGTMRIWDTLSGRMVDQFKIGDSHASGSLVLDGKNGRIIVRAGDGLKIVPFGNHIPTGDECDSLLKILRFSLPDRPNGNQSKVMSLLSP